jgi:hypothetical protein
MGCIFGVNNCSLETLLNNNAAGCCCIFVNLYLSFTGRDMNIALLLHSCVSGFPATRLSHTRSLSSSRALPPVFPPAPVPPPHPCLTANVPCLLSFRAPALQLLPDPTPPLSEPLSPWVLVPFPQVCSVPLYVFSKPCVS